MLHFLAAGGRGELGSVYRGRRERRHFPSKDALLAGLVRLRAADLAGFAGDWPAAALTYRDFLRILVVERVLRPALVTEAWRSVAALVPAPLDVDAEVMRAALAPAS